MPTSPPPASLVARIATWLPAARWFAGKDAAVAAITLYDRLDLPRQELSFVLADVRSAGGAEEQRYALVIDAAGREAAGTPAAAAWLLDAMLRGERLPGRAGTLVGHTAGLAAWPAGALVDVTTIGSDASNSSFVVRSTGGGFVVKIFRRCHPGIHPEVELGEFLVRRTLWRGFPRLCGWLEYVPASAETAPGTVIATAHELAEGCTPAWDRLVAILAAEGPHDAARIDAIVAAIGQATGEMHAALSADGDEPAFAPTPATLDTRQRTAEGMKRHVHEVCRLVTSRLPHLPPQLVGRLERLLGAEPDLVSRLDRLARVSTSAPDIRVHGDYHLGQVLVDESHARVLVIDFEGEPGRSLVERREKTSAAKDVAGMCRSFDYLVRHVARATGRPRAGLARDLETTFLTSYRAAVAGGPWWPAAAAEAWALLDAFRLDKALYELAYEISHRPDWIEVPLGAIEELAALPAPSSA